MKLDILSKALLTLIVILLTIGVFGYISIKNQLNVEQNRRQKLIEDAERSKKKIIDSLQKKSNLELERMQLDINTLSKYSKSIVEKLKKYEENPSYNIDFITAVDIIANSNYTKRGSTIGPKKNNRHSQNN